MLLNFSVTNYRSFKEQADFSMFPARPNAENKNLNKITASDGKEVSLFKTSAIYGANASGKTNFIRALHTMGSIIGAKKLENCIVPFMLSEKTVKSPTEFCITIIAKDNVIYEYGFSATKEKIHKEWLHAFPNGRRSSYYERELKGNSYEYKYSNQVKGEKKAWEKFTSHDELLLSIAKKDSKQIAPIYEWFENKLRIIGPDGIPDFFSTEYCFGSDKNKNEVLDFLTKADIRLENIELEQQEVPQEIIEIMKHLSKDDSADEEDVKNYKVSTTHKNEKGENVIFDMNVDESHGTVKMFSLAFPILNTLKEGYVLFIDELDNSLHHLLSEHIIHLFNSKKKNSHNAQLVFTTHNTAHLNNDILQRDQIWMCNRNNKKESDLYSLAEYKLRKDTKNLQTRYLAGHYNGVPSLNNEIIILDDGE